MELMGLVIIVILITFIMIFMTKFIIMEKPFQHKKEYTLTELASNTLAAILKVNMPSCKYISISELLQECAKDKNFQLVCEDAKLEACPYVKEKIKELLNETLDKRNINYELEIKKNDEIILSEGYCPGAKKSKQFAIPVGVSGTIIYVRLAICG